MENFVKRLIVEHKELCDKRNKLDAFIKSKKSNKIERGELLTMAAQFSTMNTYIDLLENRLAFHDIEVKDGLYKKIITEADVIEDVEFDDQSECLGGCDMSAGRKNDLDDIKYE